MKSTLERLDLSRNTLGGAITADIAAFTKIVELNLSNMGLEGASCVSCSLIPRAEAAAPGEGDRRDAASQCMGS